MKKIHTFLCLIFMFFITFQAYTQVPTKIWDKTIGGSSTDLCRSIVATNDGGFVILGSSFSGITGDKSEASRGDYDYWIVKINSSGQKVWDKTFGGSGFDNAQSIIATNDGGFVIAGNSGSGISGDKTEANKGGTNPDYWIVKIDNLGQKVWDKTIGGSSSEFVSSIVATSDGGFVVTGHSISGISGDKTEANKGLDDYWIVKINNLGQKVWDKTIGGSGIDQAFSVTLSSDGGYVIAGDSNSGISGDKTEANKGDLDFWIVKLNSVGQLVWNKTIGGSSADEVYSMTASSDGGFVITGRSESGISGDKTEVSRGNFDAWTVKLNSLGQKVWDKTIGGNDDERSVSITPSSDGGFVIAVFSDSGISGDKREGSRGSYDYWTVKLNSLGQKVWDKTIGGNLTDVPSSITEISDGSYVIAGESNSDISGEKTEARKGGNDYWIVKLGIITPCPTFTNNIAYVNTNATGANTGVNWANAFTSLESALSAARTCPITQIWVAKGTYKPSAYPTLITGTPTLTNRDYTFELVDGV